jgi:hypothetical protein
MFILTAPSRFIAAGYAAGMGVLALKDSVADGSGTVLDISVPLALPFRAVILSSLTRSRFFLALVLSRAPLIGGSG